MCDEGLTVTKLNFDNQIIMKYFFNLIPQKNVEQEIFCSHEKTQFEDLIKLSAKLVQKIIKVFKLW
jgi:hypothetical protein